MWQAASIWSLDWETLCLFASVRICGTEENGIWTDRFKFAPPFEYHLVRGVEWYFFFSILLFNLNDKKYFLLYSSIVLKVLIYTLLFYLLSSSFFVKQSWIYIFISKFCRDLWDEIKISWAGAYKNHDIMISDLIISLESAFGLIFSFQRNFLAATTSEEFPFVEAFRFI